MHSILANTPSTRVTGDINNVGTTCDEYTAHFFSPLSMIALLYTQQ